MAAVAQSVSAIGPRPAPDAQPCIDRDVVAVSDADCDRARLDRLVRPSPRTRTAPRGLRWMATAGTTVAPRLTSSCRRTLTNWLGNR